MTATIRTSHGEYTGRTVESIVRREYGRAATVLWSRDPSSPFAGDVVEPAGAHDPGTYSRLAVLIWAEGDREESAEDGAPLRGRGRPPIGTARYIRLPDETWAAIKEWKREQEIGSTAQAVRDLVIRGLGR